MSTHFVKLYGSILQSTIWLETPETKVLWITMLAMADSDGVVRSSVPGLAHAAGISLDACVDGLKKFESPDPYSTTQHDEGRRLRAIEGGWKLTNHDKYREMRTKKQIQDAERQRRKYERDKREVSRTSRNLALYTDTYTDTDKENNTPLPPKGGSGGKTPPAVQSELITLWNTMAASAGLPTCSGITGKRLTTLKARLKESGWWTNCPPAIAKIPACPFLTGTNDRAWRATIDWLLRPDSVTRILEGAFDNNKPTYGETHDDDHYKPF